MWCARKRTELSLITYGIDGLVAPLTLLLVEHDPRAHGTLTFAFGGSPSNVIRASSGREALQIMADVRVDIVLADERLPDVSGTLLLGHVRKQYPETIRIVVASEVTVDMALEAINVAEVFRFLRRPCAEDELLVCLRDAAVACERRRVGPRAKSESALQRDHQLHELKRAFERGLEALFIVVQPVVSAASRTTFAYEALVRTGEPLFPDAGALLEAAERLARVRDLERRIFERLGQTLPELPDGAMLLVNLHPRSLAEQELCADLSPLVPFATRVIVEITERSSLHDMGEAREQVDRLRQLGFRVAVDDLGAGYAGLTSIALLQPDFVKIDIELVRGVEASPTRAILIAGVVALCGQLGIRVIAEGVETAAEKARLIQLGCDLLQGYHIAEPGAPFPSVSWSSIIPDGR